MTGEDPPNERLGARVAQFASLQRINKALLVADPDDVGNEEEVSPEEITRLVETGELGPCLTLSWRDGSVDWLLIKDQPSMA